MLCVVLDVEVALELGSDGVHKSIYRTVAFARKCLALAIDVDLRGDFGIAIKTRCTNVGLE